VVARSTLSEPPGYSRLMHRVNARAPRTPVEAPPVLEAANDVATYLADASRYPGGSAPRVYQPRTEGQVAWVLQHEARVLPIGAQSSLTGGATPRGDAVLTLARMDRVLSVGADRCRAEAGVALISLQAALAAEGRWFPPVPTYTGALVGGVVSTNAAGAATWKYGTTREWVQALTVVLASGDVLDLERGQVTAAPATSTTGGGRFEVALPSGKVLDVPVPDYTLPNVPKRSAGYHAAPAMDLVDLFVGSEGTLGVVTEVTLRVLGAAPPSLLLLVPLKDEAAALELTAVLREASRATWRTKDPAGLDIRAVESVDARSLALLREDGLDVKNGVTLPASAGSALFIQMELPKGLDASASMASFDGTPGDDPVHRLLALLAERDALDGVEMASPGDAAREAQLLALREAVPMCVNHRVQHAQRTVDPGIHKVGGDMIVPFEKLPEMMGLYRAAFARRGLDCAIWGHISDGNLHPNVIPRALADVTAGKEALLELGREVARLGGCPLAEHGTGRNPVKQTLLRQLYGDAGVEAMRRTKRGLDPENKLARGVIFPES
jgi:D-lactate dehydrogenase (cytochrome)